MNLVDKVTKSQIRQDLPEVRVGDTVRANIKIVEGKRHRIQAFEGVVMKIQGTGVGKNFTLRKMSSGIGVERTIPFNSPNLDSIIVTRKGKVRRAKLNYLRKLTLPKIKERR